MKLNAFIFLMIILLSGMGACVSKKKYVQLSNAAQSKEQLLSQAQKKNDSLLSAMIVKDSLIDSLRFLLAESQKKEKPKYGPLLANKKNSLSKEQEYDKKALFIYNFTKYIEWPVEYNGTEFIIGVAGDESVLRQIKSFLADKKTFGKKIIVKQYVKGAKYNMVFVTSAKAGSMAAIRNNVRRNKTVLISDDDNGSAHISFLVDDDKIRYIVDKSSIEKLGLKVAQELMRYAG